MGQSLPVVHVQSAEASLQVSQSKDLDEGDARRRNELKTSVLYRQATCSGECQVCMEIKDISYVIAPCGHDGYCYDCLI